MNSSPRPVVGVPGLRSVDHVAFTVPDLDASIGFFTDHFGAVLVFRDGPFEGDAPGLSARLDIAPGVGCELAMLRLGDRLNLELFQYDAADQATVGPRNSDVGGHHLAFYVDDVDAAWAYLSAVPGVRLMAGPNGVAEESPVRGQRWFYLATPWGLHLEITTDTGSGFYDGLPGAGMVPPDAR